jgi:transcription elongation factor Elf1
MSKIIKMEWVCPACARNNEAVCKKPLPFQASIFNVTCGLCKNAFQLKVVKGNGHTVGYSFLSGPENKLTEKQVSELLTQIEQNLTASNDAQTKEV